jgi:hypothetical protein
MQKMRSMLASAVGIVFSIYMLSCSFAAVYFNYEFANNNGFMSWLMLGEISSTFEGLIWPYYFITRDRSGHSSSPLNHDEIMRFSEIVPSAEHPNLADSNIVAARIILQDHAKRTGAPLTKKLFEEQIGWEALELEWRAEVSASAAASWDNQVVTKSAKYDELRNSTQSYNTDQDRSDIDKLLIACSQRQTSFSAIGMTGLSRDTFLIVERRFRVALISFNKFVAAISDLLSS